MLVRAALGVVVHPLGLHADAGDQLLKNVVDDVTVFQQRLGDTRPDRSRQVLILDNSGDRGPNGSSLAHE